MSSKILITQQTAEMLSLIDRAIATDHAFRSPHHRHMVDGPLPSLGERATQISRFRELWTANDEIDYNTAETGRVTDMTEKPLTMLAYAVCRAQRVTGMVDRRWDFMEYSHYYVPPSRRPSMDGDIWAMLLDRHDLDMSTLDYNQAVMLVTSLSDKHAMTVMTHPSFDVNPVEAGWRFRFPDDDDDETFIEGEANTLIGWLIEFHRWELVGAMLKSVPDLSINRRHEFMYYSDSKEHMHVAMVAAVMTAIMHHKGNHEIMHKAERLLVALLGHPDTDISDSKIDPYTVNVFCIRRLLQHETVDVQKIKMDCTTHYNWEGVDDDDDGNFCDESCKNYSVNDDGK